MVFVEYLKKLEGNCSPFMQVREVEGGRQREEGTPERENYGADRELGVGWGRKGGATGWGKVGTACTRNSLGPITPA